VPTTLHDREQAFEATYARSEEFRLLLAARRDGLFARWAADKLRLSDTTANALVKSVLAIPNGPGHDQALLGRIAGALSASGEQLQERELSAALEFCGQEARRQLFTRSLRRPTEA
jgi:hypothetical protein